jgi:hypothetical protein
MPLDPTFVRFQVLTAANMKKKAVWDIASCSLVEVYRRFRGAYCLHHLGDIQAEREKSHGDIGTG